MQKLSESFPIASEDSPLYCQAVALYEKIASENSHSASINGITMGYLEFGAKEGTPLIWAHAPGGTSYEIINVQEGLVKAGFRVIAIDYRGHGNTQIDFTPYNNSLYHIADDIAALMDYLQITQAVVGGLSKGGFVAAAFYDTYPSHVLGLLLESGGSFSPLRLNEDIQTELVHPHPTPYPDQANAKLCDTSMRYPRRLDGLKAVWEAFSPAVVSAKYSVEYLAVLLATLQQVDDGTWIYHFDALKFMASQDPVANLESEKTGSVFYSRLPLMQQTEALFNPFIVFRNLDVPMHIIDADSPANWKPVRNQNAQLQKCHSDLIVHEIYEYEHSPCEAHIERPERFVSSAKALLERVKLRSPLVKGEDRKKASSFNLTGDNNRTAESPVIKQCDSAQGHGRVY